MGYYFTDPSNLGTWWVADGESPADGFKTYFTDLGNTATPLLAYSVATNPNIGKVGYGRTPKSTDIAPSRDLKSNPIKSSLTSGPSQLSCPFGYFYDEFNDRCVKIDYGEGPNLPGAPGTPGVYGGPANVEIYNAVSISNDGISQIADAINAGVSDSIQVASDVAKNSASAVTTSINSLVDGIGNTVSGLFGSVKDGLSWIVDLIRNNVGTLIGFIKDHIGSIIDGIKNVFENVIVPIFKQIGKVVDTINDTLNNTIIPIFSSISQIYNSTVGLIAAIKEDVHAGIMGLLQLPGDIAATLGSMEATINRTVQQLGTLNKETVSVTLGGTKEDTIWLRLQKLNESLTQSNRVKGGQTTIQVDASLTDPGINEALGKSFDAIWREIVTFVTTGIGSYRGFSGVMAAVPLAIPLIAEAEWELPAAMIGFVLAMIEAYKPALHYLEEDIAGKAGLAKLSPGDTLEAWRRRLISMEAAHEELKIRGWDKGRVDVLMNLQTFLIGVPEIIDMYFRGIVTEKDFRANMQEHGVTLDQQQALVERSYRLIDVGTATTGYMRGLISKESLTAVLKENRYTDNAIELHIDTLFRRPTRAELILRYRLGELQAFGIQSDPSYSSVPVAMLEAATTEGVSAELATDSWHAQFFVPQISQWIELYFRGIRTRAELDHAFDFYRIPQMWRDDLIQVSRALIPFRTIPNMLVNGVIDEPYAKQQLQARGYDLRAAEALLEYGKLAAKKKKVASSGDLHSLSVANAKEFWTLGSITDQQYFDILISHGYDQETADLTLKTEGLQLHAKERKQIAKDITDEALAGLITVDQANTQMSSHNFSDVERARVVRAISRTQKQVSKLPSESELKKMVDNDIIDLDEFANTLQIIGYSKDWVYRIVQLYFGDKNGSKVIQATT